MPVIKRYANRKLYDTEASQYITLDHIARMIRQDENVQVIDNGTSEDVTAQTLAQLIFELEKKHKGFLPRDLLANLIQIGGDRVASLHLPSLETVLERALITQGLPSRESYQKLLQQLEDLEKKLKDLEDNP